ncbi:hypothetical protein SAMN05421847_0204 [Halpernia humi]|uniref:Uncharacterized protein n=1 Tax=Halpernia humi TaxID=493375 RepID=A0A1H5SPS9_9FLAO|nr:hypothetical protein SAMN05421847_0204 [Halpernia humi]
MIILILNSFLSTENLEKYKVMVISRLDIFS